MSRLSNKQKSKIRRKVDIDLGVKAPRTIIFKSKKIYNRKNKDLLRRLKDSKDEY